MKKTRIFLGVLFLITKLLCAIDNSESQKSFVLKYTCIDLNDSYNSVLKTLQLSGIKYQVSKGNLLIIGEITGYIKSEYVTVIFYDRKVSNVIIKYNKENADFINIKKDLTQILKLRYKDKDDLIVWESDEYSVELESKKDGLMLHYYLNNRTLSEIPEVKFVIYSFGAGIYSEYNTITSMLIPVVMFNLDFVYSFAYFPKKNASIGFTVNLGFRAYYIFDSSLTSIPDVYFKFKLCNKFGDDANKAYLEYGFLILHKLNFDIYYGTGLGFSVSAGYEFTARNGFSISVGGNFDFAGSFLNGIDLSVGMEIRFKINLKRYKRL